MKRIYVNEEWCLGCHLCEFHCAFANTNKEDKCYENDMAKSLRGIKINPKIQVEEGNKINFAVSCHHCEDPMCVKSCITGALSLNDGVINIDQDKCVGCYTCILSCPYGAIMPSNTGVVQKCELCMKNNCGEPACVKACPNQAIVYEER
ncbi:MAG: 4Fe-4S dicluster domain-containing protein [Ruminococcus sp.]